MDPTNNTPLFPHYSDHIADDDLANRFNLLRPQMKWADNCMRALQNNNNSGYINVMNTPAATRKRAADPWLENVRAFLATTEAGLRHIGYSLDILLHAFEHTQMFADQAKQLRGYTMLQRSKTVWNNVWRQFARSIHNTCQKIDLVCLSENAALHHHRLSEIMPPGEVLRHISLPAAEKKQNFWEAIRLWDAFKLYPRESEAYCEAYRQLVLLTWRVRDGRGFQEGQVVEDFQAFAHSADAGELNQVASGAVPRNDSVTSGGFHFTDQTPPTIPYDDPGPPNPFHPDPPAPSIGPAEFSSPLALSRLNQPMSTPRPANLSIPSAQFRDNRGTPIDSFPVLATSSSQGSADQQPPSTCPKTVITAPIDQRIIATGSPPVQPQQTLHGRGLQIPLRHFQQAQIPQSVPTPLNPVHTSQQPSAQDPHTIPSHASNIVQTQSASAAITQSSTTMPIHQATHFVREASTPHLPAHDYLAWERYSSEDFLAYQNLSTLMNGIELDTTLENYHR